MWAGDTVNGVAFDEEPPWPIFSEAQKRIVIRNGKIIGVFLGAIFGGPFGALIGIGVGHMFDIGLFDYWLKRIGFSRSTSRQANVQQIFFNSTFTIMGYLAKSDGRVTENEIRTAGRVMDQFGLNVAMKREAIQLFTEGKQPSFDAGAYCAIQP